MEETNPGIARSAIRPTFLTVLGILSFVGIAFSLIGGIIGYFYYSTLAVHEGDMLGAMKSIGLVGDQLSQAKDIMGDIIGMDFGKMATNSLIVALLNIPILIGVLMMWKQKKIGFYIYATVEVIQSVMVFNVGGLLGVFSGILFGFVAIVFIVLYGLNLKSMV